MLDLRSYLASVPDAVLRPGPLSVVHAITALQHALEARARHPIIHVERPLLADGRPSPIGVVCNLTASRSLAARALGLADHRESARTFATRAAQPIAPVAVSRADAPVQAVVLRGDAADLRALPALRQHTLDPGPYLTAAHATTCDPDSGIDNTAIQRAWVKGARRMSWYPYPSSHNHRNLKKFWSRGEPCPVAFWIGHHPAVSIATQAKLGYGESHWAAAGGMLGAPLRLVPSVTFGERIMVPADAEVVIEGWAPVDLWEPDGPFGEFTGYMGGEIRAPVCEVACITQRENALWHDYGSGLRDMLVPDNMLMEGKLYGLVRQVTPSLANVHVPVSGRRLHAYLQMRSPAPGEARDALTAALAYRRVKAVFAVDEDIDIFDEAQVLWAVATRVQWDRDAIRIDGLTGSSLDPSWPEGAQTAAKLGVDATMGAARPFAPRAEVPEASLAAARAILDGADTRGWPAD